MPNHKSKSGGQSQGAKQPTRGGASRSSNPQAANKPRSGATAHPQSKTTTNAASKPSGNAKAPKPPQPQATAHRPSNGTKHQSTGNGAPKPQGPNGSTFSAKVPVSSVKPMSGHRAPENQGTASAPNRQGNKSHPGPQKFQGNSPKPNTSSNNDAPKAQSHGFSGGHSSPPHPGNVQHSNVAKAHRAAIYGAHVSQDTSPTSKQSGQTRAQPPKAQKNAPTPQKESTFFSTLPTNQQQSGKSSASKTFPKIEKQTTHAQHPSPGGQSSAPPAKGPEKPWQKPQQQHSEPPHSRQTQGTSTQGHKAAPPKPLTTKGQPPAEGVLSSMFSFFSAESQVPNNRSHKSPPPVHAQQVRVTPPAPSRSPRETSNKGNKNFTSTKTTVSDRPQMKLPTESVPAPKVSVSPSNHSVGSNRGENKSLDFVIPRGSVHNSTTVVNGSPQPRDVKREGPNVAKGRANVPHAAAVKPQTWGQMFSSWFLPSPHPVHAQATNKTTPSSMKNNHITSSLSSTGSSKSIKEPQAKPQASKGNISIVNPHSIRREDQKTEPSISTKGSKNGSQTLPNQAKDTDTSSSAASPKRKEAPSHYDMRSGGPQTSSRVSGNTETATNLTSAFGHAADRSQVSSNPQPSAMHHLKQFQARSRATKVLHDPKQKAALRKTLLLRQHAPTLRWRESDTPRATSAYSTLTAKPLPSPPSNEFQNKAARQTISENPDLFKVVSPIKVDVYKKYTKDHPNQSYVQSVARSLKKGFWPWADTSDSDFPITHDGSRQGSRITGKSKVDFIQKQREEEMDLERWSKPFGGKLLPGMHSAPVNVVPKSTPGKFRLIVDQSRGPHSLNSTIAKSQVKVQLDTVHDLGNELLAARKKHPNEKITLFKSDVKSAYRQIPMHPLWQIKQAIPVDGQFHIDRCNTFGNRGGGWNWNSINSSVNWIATEKKKISGLLGYVDDNFGWEFERNKKFYKPYNKHLPTKQARLLELWDELGIPHDEDKQIFGPSLPILGFQVDAKAMTVNLPDEKKAKIVKLLRSNAHEGKSYTLNELQSVAGSVGSSLSLYPRLRPGLRVLFDEMAAQEGGTTKMKVTKPVARSLSSLADYLERAPPVPIRYQKEKVRSIEARKK